MAPAPAAAAALPPAQSVVERQQLQQQQQQRQPGWILHGVSAAQAASRRSNGGGGLRAGLAGFMHSGGSRGDQSGGWPPWGQPQAHAAAQQQMRAQQQRQQRQQRQDGAHEPRALEQEQVRQQPQQPQQQTHEQQAQQQQQKTRQRHGLSDGLSLSGAHVRGSNSADVDGAGDVAAVSARGELQRHHQHTASGEDGADQTSSGALRVAGGATCSSSGQLGKACTVGGQRGAAAAPAPKTCFVRRTGVAVALGRRRRAASRRRAPFGSVSISTDNFSIGLLAVGAAAQLCPALPGQDAWWHSGALAGQPEKAQQLWVAPHPHAHLGTPRRPPAAATADCIPIEFGMSDVSDGRMRRWRESMRARVAAGSASASDGAAALLFGAAAAAECSGRWLSSSGRRVAVHVAALVQYAGGERGGERGGCCGPRRAADGPGSDGGSWALWAEAGRTPEGRRLLSAAVDAEAALDPATAAAAYGRLLAALPCSALAAAAAAKQTSDCIYVGDAAGCRRDAARVCEAAVALAERAIALDATRAECYAVRCVAAGRLALLADGSRTKVRLAKGAVDDAAEALRLDPTYDLAHHLMGRWHYEMSQIGPITRGVVRLLFGTALMDGRLDAALSHFEEASRLRPRRAIHHVEIGRTLIKMGQLEDAVGALQRALSMPIEDINSKLEHDDADSMLARLYSKRRAMPQPQAQPAQTQQQVQLKQHSQRRQSAVAAAVLK